MAAPPLISSRSAPRWLLPALLAWAVACSGGPDPGPSPALREADAGACAGDACAPAPSTVVSLTFDDTTIDHAEAAALLDDHGLRGSFYVNSPRIGRRGYLSLEELTAIAGAGHEIGGHTLRHPRLTELEIEEAEAEICDDRRNLLALGFDVVTFAWPFGAESAELRAILPSCGFVAARGVGQLRIGSVCPTCPRAETSPPAEPHAIRTPGSVRSTTRLEDLQALVELIEAEGGGWLPLVFHRICDDCTTFSVRRDDLEAFLAWLAARADGGTVALPVREALQLRLGATRPE